jgi:hypothetical protein
MFKKEEEKLVDYKNLFETIELPLNSIEDAILAGFQKAKSEVQHKPRLKTWMLGVAAAAIVLIGFFTTIRVSPVFADYIKVIPGMEKIVDLIRDDKGKMLAIENDYYQKIGVSQEKNGVKFSVDGVIADEQGLVLFYTIQSQKEGKELYIEKPDMRALDGEKLDVGGISYASPQELDKHTYNGTIHLDFQSSLKAKKLELNLKLKGNEEAYSLDFQLNKDIKVKKVYSINKTITIEGQRISILDASIYPLRVGVHIKMDPKNTKKLLDFEDLRLIDENGETWNKISNGVTATKISDDEAIIYLQSNYFKNPKNLYLVINRIQAVDKSEGYVVVDTKKQQILKQPKGNDLTDVKVENDHLQFTLHSQKEFHAFPFGRILDGNGKELISESSDQNSADQKGITIQGVTIKDLANQVNPISLEIFFYPSWIKGEEKIKIK